MMEKLLRFDRLVERFVQQLRDFQACGQATDDGNPPWVDAAATSASPDPRTAPAGLAEPTF